MGLPGHEALLARLCAEALAPRVVAEALGLPLAAASGVR
jgi:hypothetical protein